MKINDLKIYLASPRGFCAGVDRAIEIVKKSISKYYLPMQPFEKKYKIRKEPGKKDTSTFSFDIIGYCI